MLVCHIFMPYFTIKKKNSTWDSWNQEKKFRFGGNEVGGDGNRTSQDCEVLGEQTQV